MAALRMSTDFVDSNEVEADSAGCFGMGQLIAEVPDAIPKTLVLTDYVVVAPEPMPYQRQQVLVKQSERQKARYVVAAKESLVTMKKDWVIVCDICKKKRHKLYRCTACVKPTFEFDVCHGCFCENAYKHLHNEYYVVYTEQGMVHEFAKELEQILIPPSLGATHVMVDLKEVRKILNKGFAHIKKIIDPQDV